MTSIVGACAEVYSRRFDVINRGLGKSHASVDHDHLEVLANLKCAIAESRGI